MGDAAAGGRVAAVAASTRSGGRLHLVLGSPWSDLCDKTVVEPGGAFSPGVWTCGITFWVESREGVHGADLAADEEVGLAFADDGLPPVVRTCWPAGDRTVVVELATLAGPGAEGADFVSTHVAAGAAPATVHLVVRGAGPAGGILSGADWHESRQVLELASGTRLHLSPEPDTVTVLPDGNGGGVLVDVRWAPVDGGATAAVEVRVEHAFVDRPGGDLVPLQRPYAQLTVAQGHERAREEWKAALPARVFAPDPAVARAWEANAFHLLANAETGVPRIGAVDYPVLWVRDAVSQVHALDLAGRHDLARAAAEHLAPLVFAGGFGAEADAPGQGIHVLAGHAAITRDPAWLRTVYPHIVTRVIWLDRMRTATEPLRAPAVNRMPGYLASPAINLVCLPAEGGLIRGRMDWHYPALFVNAWAVAGYTSAAWAARQLGLQDDADRWSDCGARLDERLGDLLGQYGNERDPAALPYPTGALRDRTADVRDAFLQWFRANRLDSGGRRVPEPLWTYFEAAQAHNALRLGLVREAWSSLHGMIDADPQVRMGIHGEGVPGGKESLPYGPPAPRGSWLDVQAASYGNMPHGWTNAEMIAALRAVFVQETDDTLLLGPGVPPTWWQPGATFGVSALPTRHGELTFVAEADESRPGEWDLRVADSSLPWAAALPA